MIKPKFSRKGLEKYFENFKEYIAGDNKIKASVTCTLCKEIVWQLKHVTSNYTEYLQRKHKVEFDLWSKQVCKNKKESKNKQIFIEGSSASYYG